MEMKRLFCCVLFCILLMETMAFAQCGFETDVKEIAVEAAQGDILLSVEGGNFKVGARCRPERAIHVELPPKGSFKGKKLYFEMRGSEHIWFDMGGWEEEGLIQEDKRIFSVSLEDAQDGGILFVPDVFMGREIQGGEEISLWLLGGEDYGDNLLREKEDLKLREDFIHFLTYEREKRRRNIMLASGKDEFYFNGETKKLHAPIYWNEGGHAMIAARDIAMILEGKEQSQGGIVWKPETKTAVIQAGVHKIEMTAGEKTWKHMDVPLTAETVPELKDGALFVPLREMAEIFEIKDILGDKDSGILLLSD